MFESIYNFIRITLLRDRILRKEVRTFITTTKHEDEFLLEQIIDDLKGIGPQFIREQDYLERITKTIRKLDQINTRLVRFSFASFLLLFASISGVKFNISFLGVSLEDVQLIKEVIYILFLYTIFYTYTSHTPEIRRLKALRRKIGIKMFGEKKYRLMEVIYNNNTDMANSWATKFGEDYYLSSRELIKRSFLNIARGLTEIVASLTFLYIIMVCSVDIWNNSNFPKPTGPAIVLTFLSSAILILIYSAIMIVDEERLFLIDKRKIKELEKLWESIEQERDDGNDSGIKRG